MNVTKAHNEFLKQIGKFTLFGKPISRAPVFMRSLFALNYVSYVRIIIKKNCTNTIFSF